MGQSKKSCFIVDDDKIIRLFLEKIMTDMNFDCSTYEDGDSAIFDCMNRLPDVILLDLNMPGMGGMEFLKHVRKIEREHKENVIVVMCSGEGENVTIGKTMVAGANAYIKKPFYPDQVKQILLDVQAQVS